MSKHPTSARRSSCHVHEDDVPWGDYSAYYPEKLMRTMRAKRLMGPGGSIERSDKLLGILELDPGAIYPLHRHEAPEAYYVTQGEAECRFGEEQFIAKAGSAIYTEPNQPHSLRNVGKEKFVALGFWWAPGGKTETLECDLVLLEKP